ncbi:RrF2 family transcriptional regulator [Vagococcus vulneris]|uniref:Rrf2 family transcriptional regulator n=1 Tax=Vagococcus vulneris TaxID=1977869 RepID=A0A429ZYX3_9ENTE|nr:Rrf2 family transcriptional regulator [Vagococcus vulneris]RST99173.1 hypothetical protein CBF37_05775 [Vagococcus vulneris]
MKFSNAFIQSIAIVVMLAELPKDIQLKSYEISSKMGVSHSYLQKIAKKLKDANIIDSEASKNGGYSLSKAPNEISFLDLFVAIETNDSFVKKGNYEIIHNMFDSKELILEYGELSRSILQKAEINFKNTLSHHLISEVIPKDKNGNYLKINWKDH